MARISAISGFPEWNPEQQLLQERCLAHLRSLFALHGFLPLHTRHVEPLEVLQAKGQDVDKEIYVLRRLNAEPDEEDAGLALHFDLTVPFARFVAERRGDLQFPYKRYQIQPVWRGERPQLGRYREFLQADIDIIGMESLDLRADAEVLRLLAEVMSTLPIGPTELKVNNRKLLEGVYRAIGIDDVASVLRVADKLDKIGADGVRKQLDDQGVPASSADVILAVAQIRSADSESLRSQVRGLGVSHSLLDEGLDELCSVLQWCESPSVVADLSVARGLDYYTGTVVEGYLVGRPDLGAVCSGGRYDNLAGSMGSGPQLPGVGVSLGITRILGYLFSTGLLEVERRSPTDVLILLPGESSRSACDALAQTLRKRGISAEVFHRKTGWGKQMKRAQQLGIPYVWFPAKEGGAHTVKHLASGEQTEADPASWQPDPAEQALPIRFEGTEMRWPQV